MRAGGRPPVDVPFHPVLTAVQERGILAARPRFSGSLTSRMGRAARLRCRRARPVLPARVGRLWHPSRSGELRLRAAVDPAAALPFAGAGPEAVGRCREHRLTGRTGGTCWCGSQPGTTGPGTPAPSAAPSKALARTGRPPAGPESYDEAYAGSLVRAGRSTRPTCRLSRAAASALVSGDG
jgi:hypothetical protein